MTPNLVFGSIQPDFVQLLLSVGKFLFLLILAFLTLGLFIGVFTYGHPPKEPGKNASELEAVVFLGMILSHRIIDRLLGKKPQVGSWLDDRQIIWNLRGMRPGEFEVFVTQMFTRLGYQAQRVGGSGDGGIDIEMMKDGRRYLVQCKKFITRKVNPHDIRDFFGAMGDRRIDGKGFFVTTHIFTLEAERFAEGKPIELIDETRLVQWVRESGVMGAASSKEANQQKIEKCPKCGSQLVMRTNGKSGERFWGCSRYPSCHYTKQV